MRTEKNHCPLPILSRKRKQKQPKTEGCIGGDDLISKLPDEILVRVLSLLAPREVIRCGALSHRWTTPPKLVPMTLKFVRKKEKKKEKWSQVVEARAKFIHEVNQVLDSYPGDTLTELTISYPMLDLPLDMSSQFDKWVQFAMTKKVRKFSLNLRGYMRDALRTEYQFPPILYDTKRLISRDIGLPSCTSLTDLRLEFVNVTNKHIENFLEFCPFLESLCVILSYTLTSIKIDGPIRLKFLEIQDCKNLQVFEICAPNLISFKYLQYPMKIMPLKCAPQLNELLVSDYDFIIDNFPQFTSYFAQIETLSLVIKGSKLDSCPEFQWPTGIPTLRNLKHLTIRPTIYDNESLLCFSPWIEASPLLRRFVFEERGLRGNTSREAEKPRTCAHHHLEEAEFVGFVGDVSDMELAMYIIENAVNLHKIIFDCSDPRCEDNGREGRSRARVRARELQSLLSPSVEFVLIA